MKALDTNLLLRYLVQDDPAQFRKAESYMRKHCTGEHPGFINRMVLCELVWVLEGFYGYSRAQIAAALDSIFRTTHLAVENVDLAWEALRSYRSTRADYADCLIGKVNRRAGYDKTATFDKLAGKLEEFETI